MYSSPIPRTTPSTGVCNSTVGCVLSIIEKKPPDSEMMLFPDSSNASMKIFPNSVTVPYGIAQS